MSRSASSSLLLAINSTSWSLEMWVHHMGTTRSLDRYDSKAITTAVSGPATFFDPGKPMKVTPEDSVVFVSVDSEDNELSYGDFDNCSTILRRLSRSPFQPHLRSCKW
ncbi:uncharacterized protein LY89DRAFT_687589 [Mollisia scopiformis]|uniref:Uncharacterized protein n=1 Tax=Mollisia scopiformis TaxID=149040 RepID=A0A194X009_MOLSC|nr:uncharacterized protein LY89DRAFT_687589 [Mollisia scopiformis]KUJ13525.1 hypothetical protein LY89DRAFT_687589 [Mollisia scopiformis]